MSEQTGQPTPEQFSAPYSPSNVKNFMALQNAEAEALSNRYGF